MLAASTKCNLLTCMMQNYSENWRHLKSILTGYATENVRHRVYSYTDHMKAKALSIFLSHAALGTPKLDRPTVEALLAGRQSWPHTVGMQKFEGTNLPLSLFEENGLVAFYAGWCTIHCQPVRDLEKADPSLLPLIRAIQLLTDICYGQNGYIQPHYTCPKNKLEELFAPHFGNRSVLELLPELRLQECHFMLPPGNQNFSSLVSTYLWHRLRESLEPEQAFGHWILCLRVNCTWGMPVLLDYLELEDLGSEDRTEFTKQLIAHLAQDGALHQSVGTLLRQIINEESFSAIVTPVETHVRFTIDAEGRQRSTHEDVELDKPTLTNLSSAYPPNNTDNSGDLEFVQQWQRFRHYQGQDLFYTSLVASIIENSIGIYGKVLTSWGNAEALFELASDRPILKYLLLNLLPAYASSTYLIWLLSRPATSDIALLYLSKGSPASFAQDGQAFIQHLDKAYMQLVCHEYLRTLNDEPKLGNRLLKILDVLGSRCGLHANDFSKKFEHQFLFCLLDNLSHQHVIDIGQVFAPTYPETVKTIDSQPPQHHWYLLGFWLIERLEDGGIDPAGTLTSSVKATLLEYYKAEFKDNLVGRQNGLRPHAFFSALPWHKLIGSDGGSSLLTLSNNCSEWRERLSYSSECCSAVASAVRHYLQILMCVGRPQRLVKNWERVALRLVEIVRILGFGPRGQAAYLFNETFYPDQYDLWSDFSSYINLLQDSLYDEFVDRCVPRIPLNQLFVLLERCHIISRAQQLEGVITSRQALESEGLGLQELEQAFVSACRSGNTGLAKKLIDTAKAFMNQDAYANTKNPRILNGRKVWMSYEYKAYLMSLLETLKQDPNKFAEAAREIPIPHESPTNANGQDDRAKWLECEHFRRYIIAAAYLEADPGKCVSIMNTLYQETKDLNHSFLLFQGHRALQCNNGDATRLRHALSQFLLSLGDTEQEHMLSQWVASILDTYRRLHNGPALDAFWMKLTPDQQATIEVMHSYCLALIERGETLSAQQVFNRYRERNPQTHEGLGHKNLIDELYHALPRDLPISQLVHMVTEGSQRSIVQLAKHYNEIVSQEFDDYVAIVGNRQQPHEFLKNAMLEVAQELLLRKQNLQIHSANEIDKASNRRITKEDLINDWFTSLFDKRMAEARIGLRDQKRGGQSESGNSPGEIDGYITDAKNKRIAIFEAFRLFSKDTTVISEHLDKIAKYDNEALSPVFIVAYCDVSDFPGLALGYREHIARRDYFGFKMGSEAACTVETLRDTGLLWLGMERRLRNHREVTFYHILLNMGVEAKISAVPSPIASRRRTTKQ